MKKSNFLKSVMFLLAIVLTIAAVQMPAAASTVGDNSLIMHINSPLVLDNGKVDRLDDSNADVVPVLSGNRTLVPLKTVAEYFKATVDYDALAKTAIIDKDGVRYTFPIGEKYYLVDGKKKVELDVATKIINQRTMLPLRAIAEQVFGQKVSYYDQIIVIGSKTVDLKADQQTCNSIKDKIGQALHPQTLAELKNYLNWNAKSASNENKMIDSAGSAQSAEDSASNEVTSNDQDSYSRTNSQVDGIDEADIVKTDGQYIYVVTGQDVVIVKANGSDMQEIGRIKGQENVYISDIFIDNDRLVLMGNYYDYVASDDPILYQESSEKVVSAPYRNTSRNYVYTAVYDTTDKSSPQLLKEVEAEGSFVNSRKNGDYVYIVASQYTYWLMSSGVEDDQILPMVKDSKVSDQPEPIALNDLMICPQQNFDCYTTVAAININDTDEDAQFESFAGSVQDIYMNDSSLYLAFYDWQEETTMTDLIALDVNQTNINYRAGGAVEGYLLNQFAMDEYDGYFRIATTTSDKGCNLYVLDQYLNQVGSATDIVTNERIYAARFSGDKGYLVTYENVDPLFILDLSDPANPTVTGQLELPGFSNYLHVVDENTLLGIGYDTEDMFVRDHNGNETPIGTRTGGIKLSLFDVSDPNNPQLLDEYVTGGSGSYADVLYDHKALMVNSDQGVLGFCATLIANGEGYEQYFSGALLFEVNNGSISELGEITYQQPADNEKYQYYQRLAYIGDTIYYLQDGVIRAFDRNSLEELASISI